MFTKSLSPLEQSFDCAVSWGKSYALDDIQEALDDIQDEAKELLSEAFAGCNGNSIGPGRHLTTNILEEYALRRAVKAERDFIEYHLSVCDFCTGKLEKANRVIPFLKSVLIPAIIETGIAVDYYVEDGPRRWDRTTTMPPQHFTDETFELYLLNLADEDLKKMIEEHLLGCDLCLDEIHKVEETVMAMKASSEQKEIDGRAEILMARLTAGDFQFFKPFVN